MATEQPIYHDNGAANGMRTRLFRNTAGGVEWIYAVDYAAGSDRWFFYHPGAGRSVEDMIAKGEAALLLYGA